MHRVNLLLESSAKSSTGGKSLQILKSQKYRALTAPPVFGRKIRRSAGVPKLTGAESFIRSRHLCNLPCMA